MQSKTHTHTPHYSPRKMRKTNTSPPQNKLKANNNNKTKNKNKLTTPTKHPPHPPNKTKNNQLTKEEEEEEEEESNLVFYAQSTSAVISGRGEEEERRKKKKKKKKKVERRRKHNCTRSLFVLLKNFNRTERHRSKHKGSQQVSVATQQQRESSIRLQFYTERGSQCHINQGQLRITNPKAGYEVYFVF